MSSNAELLDQLLSSGVSNANPVSDSVSSEEVSPVVVFPSNERLQDVILRLALRGDTMEDISAAVGKPVEVVDKLLRSEWARCELERIAKEAPEKQDSLRNLIRVNAFSAVQEIVKIYQNEKVNAATRLAACRTILEYSIIPARMKDVASKDSDMPTSKEKLVEERQRLTEDIRKTQEQLSKPI